MIRRMMVLTLMAACLATSAPAQTKLNGAGATFPYPIYSKWFSEYNKVRPDVQINYQSIGSGGGIRQVLAGTVDFGATDGPMNDDQLRQAKGKIFHIPTVLGAGQQMATQLTYAPLPKEVSGKVRATIAQIR